MATADRRIFLEYLKLNGLSVSVYGPNSPNGFVSNQQYNNIIQSSKINLNFTKTLVNP